MFFLGTREKSDFVEIQDVDADVFRIFLYFLYTASEEDITPENALQLYTLADKYEVTGLKECCLDHVLDGITVENCCDVFRLALRHNHYHLLEACCVFFEENLREIIIATKMCFMEFYIENFTIVNDILIRVFRNRNVE